MKNWAKGTMQIKDKMKSEIGHGGKTIIVIDDDGEKSKMKRKHLGKGKAVDQITTHQKKKKKHSKRQKSCAEYPLSTFYNNRSSDLKSLKEAEQTMSENSSDSDTGKAPQIFKKTKKGRGCCEQGGVHEVPNEAQQEISSLSKKTHKKAIPASHCNAQDFAPKKKRKHLPTSSMMLLQNEDNEIESGKPSPKKPKLTSQEGKMLSGNKRGPIHLNAARDRDIVEQEHNGVCYLASADSPGSSNGIGCARTDSQLKEECSSQGRALVCGRHHENDVENEMTQKRKKKRKEKLKAKEVASVFVDNQEGDFEHLGTKTEREKVATEVDISFMRDAEGAHQTTKKKKKKKQAKAENDCPSLTEDHESAFTSGRETAVKRRKKDAKKAKKVEVHNDVCGFTEEVSKPWVRKGRKSDQSKEEPSRKKAKVKDEAKEGEEEIKTVAVKEGNCDDVGVDKDAHFGQWGTSTFESLERKNKFLRLLGGFKHSSAAAAQSSPAHAAKPRMALTQAGEKHLLQNLQAEFDKARDFKQFRGTGLGFQSGTQKRVVIDKYASKSIKFES